MIDVKNKFENDNLEIAFSGGDIEEQEINISIANDVNFKPIIDYLIQIIPKNIALNSTFEDFSDQENVDKLDLISETIQEIYEKFNEAIDNSEVSTEDNSGVSTTDEAETEHDDLPF